MILTSSLRLIVLPSALLLDAPPWLFAAWLEPYKSLASFNNNTHIIVETECASQCCAQPTSSALVGALEKHLSLVLDGVENGSSICHLQIDFQQSSFHH